MKGIQYITDDRGKKIGRYYRSDVWRTIGGFLRWPGSRATVKRTDEGYKAVIDRII